MQNTLHWQRQENTLALAGILERDTLLELWQQRIAIQNARQRQRILLPLPV